MATYKENNILVEKTEDFALRVVNVFEYLQKHGEKTISSQVLRSGTSIGANVAEAQFAQSHADFISKLHISLKEASETDFWMRLLKRAGYISEREYASIKDELKSIISILVVIIKTAKSNK